MLTAEVGIVLVRGVPVDASMVRLVAELIAPVQRTIYGETWDVLADPQPINVAYSDAQLDFHMDLSYYESPPGQSPDAQKFVSKLLKQTSTCTCKLVAWHSGRTSVSGRRTFPVLRSTCS